jgi:AcrR family transcriptional regulator
MAIRIQPLKKSSEAEKSTERLTRGGKLTRGDKEAAKRQEIMDAAARCFMLRGYYATTIDQIADLNGSTKGLIYYHFSSKTDLFFEVYRLAMMRTLARGRPFLSEPGSGATRLARLCQAHIFGMMRNLPYHHVAKQGVELHMLSALTPDQQATLRDLIKLRDEYEQVFIAVIKSGVTDGSLRPVDPSLAARTILGGLNGVSVWFRPRAGQRETEMEQLAEKISEMIVGGVGCAPRSESVPKVRRQRTKQAAPKLQRSA